MEQGVLDGVRVLDFGRYIAAPFCSSLLADLGAEVVRVEQIDGNEDRYLMPVTPAGEGAMHLQVNRNKKSLAIDIARPEGREIIRRLIGDYDVVVANLTPKVLSRLGLDYATVSAINPRIVLTTITSYGTAGPFGDVIGFDGIGQALSGGVYLTGVEDQPFRSAVSYVDYATGISAGFGTLAAIMSRSQTGLGQHIEASLLKTALTMTNTMLIEEATGARRRKPIGNRSPVAGPSDIVATSDGWMLIQVVGQDMFARWAGLVGASHLVSDPRFADDIGRGEHGAILTVITAKWCRGRTTDDCLAELKAQRIPSCRVLSPAEALHAPEVGQRGFFSWQRRDDLATAVPIVTSVASLSAAPYEATMPAPELGADTREILLSAGYGEPEIARLAEQRVVNCGDVRARRLSAADGPSAVQRKDERS